MKTVLDDFLAVFSPFVAVVEDIDIASCLETETRFSELSPDLNFGLICVGVSPPATQE